MNRKLTMASALLVALVAFVYSYTTVLFHKTPRMREDALELKDSRVLSSLFREYYEKDEGFRRAIDRIREMIFNSSQTFNATRAWKLYNMILEKLGLRGMALADFKYGRGSIYPVKSTRTQICKYNEAPSRYLPLIKQPLKDVENGNGLEAAYICVMEEQHGVTVEVTLVFSDEDKAQGLASYDEDVYYDVWRLISWGRIEDIETFFIHHEEGLRIVDFSSFYIVVEGWNVARRIAGIYSGSAGLLEAAHGETSITVFGEELALYVNTWNHAFSLVNNNPGLPMVAYTPQNVTIRVGSRMDAENYYSQIGYAGEIILNP